jgi:hypothetical protein
MQAAVEIAKIATVPETVDSVIHDMTSTDLEGSY